MFSKLPTGGDVRYIDTTYIWICPHSDQLALDIHQNPQSMELSIPSLSLTFSFQAGFEGPSLHRCTEPPDSPHGKGALVQLQTLGAKDNIDSSEFDLDMYNVHIIVNIKSQIYN